MLNNEGVSTNSNQLSDEEESKRSKPCISAFNIIFRATGEIEEQDDDESNLVYFLFSFSVDVSNCDVSTCHKIGESSPHFFLI